MHVAMMTIRSHVNCTLNRLLDRTFDADQPLTKCTEPYVLGKSESVELYVQSQQGHQSAAHHMFLKACCLITSTRDVLEDYATCMMT